MYISKFLCEFPPPFPLQAAPPPQKKGASFTNSLLIILEPNEPKLDFDLLYSKVLASPFEVC